MLRRLEIGGKSQKLYQNAIGPDRQCHDRAAGANQELRVTRVTMMTKKGRRVGHMVSKFGKTTITKRTSHYKLEMSMRKCVYMGGQTSFH